MFELDDKSAREKTLLHVGPCLRAICWIYIPVLLKSGTSNIQNKKGCIYISASEYSEAASMFITAAQP